MNLGPRVSDRIAVNIKLFNAALNVPSITGILVFWENSAISW